MLSSRRRDRYPRGDRRDVHSEHRLPVARAAQGFAAQKHRDYLGLWNWDGTLDRIHHALYLKCREKAAREASPTACIIVPVLKKGGSHRGDAGKLTERHVLVDTQGLQRTCATAADRATAVSRCWRRGLFPFLGKLFADAPIRGRSFTALETEIVKRSDRVKGFVVVANAPSEPLPPTGQGPSTATVSAFINSRPFDSCAL